jgi:hypothetical protein
VRTLRMSITAVSPSRDEHKSIQGSIALHARYIEGQSVVELTSNVFHCVIQEVERSSRMALVLSVLLVMILGVVGGLALWTRCRAIK